MILVATAVALHGAGLWLLRSRPAEWRPEEGATRWTVSVLPSDAGERSSAVREQLWLFDPEPLFLPTRWNAVDVAQIQGQDGQQGSLHIDYGPQWMFEGERLAPRIGPERERAVTAVDLLQDDGGRKFAGFGRQSISSVVPLSGLVVEVRSADTGELQWRERLEGASVGAMAFTGEPMEIVVAVGPLGVVGAPVGPTAAGPAGDGATAWRFAVLRELRLGARLEPGFYRVVVGP